MKILFLPRWYPDRNDPMPGLFVQRQAEAVSVRCKVAVLYVTGDRECRRTYEKEVSEERNVSVVRIYYKPCTGLPGFLQKLVSTFRFFNAHRIGFSHFKKEKPDLVHVHVLTREGLIAFAYRLVTGIPYVITEHWSRYFPRNSTYNGLLRRLSTRMVVKSASAMIAVSEKLKGAMQDQGLHHPEFRVIPNPVDMEVFTPGPESHPATEEKKKIIHISCFEDKSKNITGFLKVLNRISKIRNDFVCALIGEGPDREMCMKLSNDLNFPEGVITFPGLQSGIGLVSEIRNADFLVLSSHYETFASVIIESLACGTPVVSTDVGIAERVISRVNGLVVPPGDNEALEKAIVKMLDICRTNYDRAKVRETIGMTFSNNTIGDKLTGLYETVLDKK